MLRITIDAVGCCRCIFSEKMSVMNKSIKRNFLLLISLATGLVSSTLVFGVEKMQSLNAGVGATDAFKITCSPSVDGATDHLNFKILDTTADTVVPGEIAPQLLNVHVAKGKKDKPGYLSKDVTSIAPGEKTELELTGGKGGYKFTVDTLGTNTAILTKQTFAIEYRCLNADDEYTKPKSARFKTGKIKNGKTKKLSATCSKNKTTGDTAKLFVRFTNTTAGSTAKVLLNAQVIKDNKALNVTDSNGDDVYSDEASLKGGDGDYTVLVNSTASRDMDNAKDYSMQFSCLNAASIETGIAEIVQIQDR